MPRIRYDVFLSYSRADTARVQPLLDELRRLGYRVFFDVQSIVPGEQWKTRLERSISASRTLVLCWSENTRSSEYIAFEYSRAQALHKPILPWMLDKTPLPAMLEIQAIPSDDPVKVAAELRPALGRTLGRRRQHQVALAALCAVILAIGLWEFLKPPPPWEFQGEVIDRVSRVGIPGVEVDATSDQTAPLSTHTDANGRFDLHLPQPQPKYIHLVFRKEGYVGDADTVPTNKPFDTDLERMH
jgi:hypothetical protein